MSQPSTSAFAVWITGLPASGKSTLARALAQALETRGAAVAVLESDALRPVLTPAASYSEQDRENFYRALAFVGALLVRHGVPVIFDATANRRKHRAYARSSIDRFVEIYVDCPVSVCKRRDPKGLYRTAETGGTTALPGVQSPYEPPEHPDLIVSGERENPQRAAGRIVELLEGRGYLQPRSSIQELAGC